MERRRFERTDMLPCARAPFERRTLSYTRPGRLQQILKMDYLTSAPERLFLRVFMNVTMKIARFIQAYTSPSRPKSLNHGSVSVLRDLR